jgi:hypothetical protein
LGLCGKRKTGKRQGKQAHARIMQFHHPSSRFYGTFYLPVLRHHKDGTEFPASLLIEVNL